MNKKINKIKLKKITLINMVFKLACRFKLPKNFESPILAPIAQLQAARYENVNWLELKTFEAFLLA